MDFFRVFASMLQEGAPGELVRQLQLFAVNFFKSAPRQLGLQMLGEDRCARSRCGEKALATCLGCGDPVCLAHAYCSADAHVLCSKCARLAIRNISGNRSWGRDAPREDEPAPRGPVRIDPVTLAFITLGLAPSSDFDQVKKRYRALTFGLHPDRLGHLKPEQRQEAEAMSKRYSEAYHVLEKHLQRAA